MLLRVFVDWSVLSRPSIERIRRGTTNQRKKSSSLPAFLLSFFSTFQYVHFRQRRHFADGSWLIIFIIWWRNVLPPFDHLQCPTYPCCYVHINPPTLMPTQFLCLQHPPTDRPPSPSTHSFPLFFFFSSILLAQPCSQGRCLAWG